MTGEFTADLAVIIGIGAYDPAVGRLETPVTDAEGIASLLASRFGYEVILRCDGEATRERLLDLLETELPRRVCEGSRLLFYFAGHGVAADSAELEGPRGFLVPQDATSAVATHLPMEDVREALAGLSCRHLLVVLDCCFSGAFHWEGRRPVHVPGELLYEERYRHWVQHPARWALASAAHDEYALDIADRRRGQIGCHSPFAASLLDGLQGAADCFPENDDGIITLAELYAYVQQRLAPHQSPVLAPLKGQTRGEYVFRDPRASLALQSAEIVVQLKPEVNPYRGLEPYKTEHADRFFGRGAATRLLQSHVEAHPLSVVVGPSGSGKSSLVHAGLLPCLHRETETLWVAPPPFRVAGDPLAALRASLVAAGGPAPADESLSDPNQAETWATLWAAANPSKRLLLVVDQAEELVARVARSGVDTEQEPIPEEATRFLASLAALIQGGGGQVQAVVVVRSDYETDLNDGIWSPLWKDGRFVVPSLRREDLREIIEGPAATKALYFDDPRLVDRLVDEVWGMPGGLPLLSYALSRLYLAYVKESRGDRLLTARDLAAIGGEPGGEGKGTAAPGAIVRILRDGADEAVRSLPDDEHRKTLWRILLRMVHLIGTRTTRRQVPKDELIYPEEIENRRVDTIRDRFVNGARLLVSSQDAGRDLIEPAHDELLVAWPELVRQIDEARVHLPAHRRLTEAAAEWAAPANTTSNGRHPKRDLDLNLLELVEASGLPEDWLNKMEADYVAAARRVRRRRTALRWSLAAAILLVTTGLALFFRYQSQRNERLRYQEIIQRLVNQAEASLGSQEKNRALLLACQAFAFLPQSEGTLTSRVDRLLRRILEGLPPSRAVLRDIGRTSPIAFYPSGRLLVAGSRGGLHILTLPAIGIVPTGTHILPSPSGESASEVAFSSDGQFLAAGFEKGSLCVWSLRGKPQATFPSSCVYRHPAVGLAGVTGLAFRPGLAVLVVGRESGGGTGSIEVWTVDSDSSGKPALNLRSERKAPGPVSALAVSAAGEIFVATRYFQVVSERGQVLREDAAKVLRGSIDPAGSLRPLSLTLQDPKSRPGWIETINRSKRRFEIRHLELVASGRGLIGTTGKEAFIWGLTSNAGPVVVERGGTAFRAAARLCDGRIEDAVESNGERGVSSCDGVVRLWDLRDLSGGCIRGIGQERCSPWFGSTTRTVVSVSTPTAVLIRPESPSTLALGSDKGEIEFLDLTNRKWLIQARPVTGVPPDVDPTRPATGRDEPRVTGLAAETVGYSVIGADGLWWHVGEKGSATRLRWLGGSVCAGVGSADGVWLATISQTRGGQLLAEVWPITGKGGPVLSYLRSNDRNACRGGLAFHPSHSELAVGIGSEITVWSPISKGQWGRRKLAEFDGRITALAWRNGLLAAGGESTGEDGSIELLQADTGKVRYRWAVPGAFRVNSLAFEPEGRRLAAGTDSGGLQVWDLEFPNNPPLVLGQETEGSIWSPVFLRNDRIAALTVGTVLVWDLSTERLATAACNMAPGSLSWRDWIAFVEPDLGRYVPACPGLGPDPPCSVMPIS